MKIFKIILAVTFIVYNAQQAQSQLLIEWTGLGDGHSYSDNQNWNPQIVPTATDTIVFNQSASVDQVPDIISVFISEIKINTGAFVNLKFASNINVHLTDNLYIASSASLSVTENASDVNLRIVNKADIYGEIFFDNGSHKIETNNLGGITFYAGSKFVSGSAFSGYPFGMSGTNINTVIFKNGSSFVQNGGNSPFGPEGTGGYITQFESDSYYEITGGDGSLINFSGKYLGNIVNNSGNNITVVSTSASISTFMFSSLTTLNGGFQFEGNDFDRIEIYGQGVNAQNGNISLQTGQAGISFSASSSTISGTSSVEFWINSTAAADFSVVQPAKLLVLENDLSIIGYNAAPNIHFDGTLDCRLNKLNLSNTNFVFSESSTLITANMGGVEASVANAHFASNYNLIFNGTSPQNTGLSSFPFTDMYSLKINNPSGVSCDSDIKVNTELYFSAGKLFLNNYNLILNTSFSITSSNTNSYIVTNSTGSVIINSITASTSINCVLGTPNIRTEVNYFTLNALGNLRLRVFDGVYLDGNSGNLITFDDIIPVTWEILPDAAGSQADITLSWQSSSTTTSFDILNAYISNYTISGWDLPGTVSGTTSTDMTSVSRNSLSNFGLFHVSSHVNSMPHSEDTQIILAKNFDYIFRPANFPIFDNENDTLYQIKIGMLPLKGILYLDYNSDFTADAGESVQMYDTIAYNDVFILKYKPVADEFGDAADNFYYTEFQFYVNDGFVFGTTPNILKISVTDNNPPKGEYAEFRVRESPGTGFFVGQLIATDPDTDQTIGFAAIEGDTVSFEITRTGEVLVRNPEAIVFSINPEFYFTVYAFDNGLPILRNFFGFKIIVENSSEIKLNIANLLTPNSDGHNDFWIIEGAPETISGYETLIFDNSGRIVFRSQLYSNDWNGVLNGENLPQGVYYYLLRSENDEKKGTITLLR